MTWPMAAWVSRTLAPSTRTTASSMQSFTHRASMAAARLSPAAVPTRTYITLFSSNSRPSEPRGRRTAIAASIAAAALAVTATIVTVIATPSTVQDLSISCDAATLPKSASSSTSDTMDMITPMQGNMETLVRKIQTDMVAALEDIEGPTGKRFMHDAWIRKEGGYGTSCVLQDGRVFEKAGVNITVISSPAPKAMLANMRARSKDTIDPNGSYNMFVAGISMVVHPHNPMAPTFHANYRYFELRDASGSTVDTHLPAAAWFGGGCDLTPSYLFEEDAVHFHKVIKDACNKHDPTYYPRFKIWCDAYFNNIHRGERRGIGGIFFDDLEDKPIADLFAFVSDCGNSLVNQYIPIVKRRMNMPFTAEQKEWQQMRRGRYVEFNLVHDRGTKFGFVTPGVRIESVLMSLPLTARWQYCHTPEPGSPEEKLLDALKTPRDWV
ncbi:hypothetical protein BASA50_002491 [Batrachochytrium salamandrivorans]|uniref:coproporphyrinogen oxidase n=1 Tax=Batrachochytrium salamandrivorans TaxID=1357716 RepID=A0ABQ8FL88_9FUNG|nr:hypothetical protein BASA50_002491 [Batrachochytrium salamandrivorans]